MNIPVSIKGIKCQNYTRTLQEIKLYTKIFINVDANS